MKQTMIFHDLRDAFAKPGCPICRLNATAAGRYIDGFLWENVNDPAVREQFRRAQGLCHRHSSQLVRPGASLGVAILMHDVLQSVLGAMEDARFEPLPALSLRRAQEKWDPGQPSAATAELVGRLTPQAGCPVCVHIEETEDTYLTTLVEHLSGAVGLLPSYRASDGLCLTHFRRALRFVRDREVFHSIVNAQRAIWRRLEGHLAEAIRKSDYRFRDEPPGDESGAWLRGIAALTGSPSRHSEGDTRP